MDETISSSVWQTSRRSLPYGDRTLVMGIVNVTPDSFSDGGSAFSPDDALRRADRLVSEGADIIDVGGESTRPGSSRVAADEEIRRTIPVVEAITRRFDVPVSIDTSKAEVAEAAVEAGAEIINDISGVTFDQRIAEIAARHQTGLVLMHLRGSFETMHRQEPVSDIIGEVIQGFESSLDTALAAGLPRDNLALDVGIGFSKALEQNLQLVARLAELKERFRGFPFLIGASRKSFIGNILDQPDSSDRLYGSLGAAAIAVWNGADILRVHDVAATVEVARMVEALRPARSEAVGG